MSAKDKKIQFKDTIEFRSTSTFLIRSNTNISESNTIIAEETVPSTTTTANDEPKQETELEELINDSKSNTPRTDTEAEDNKSLREETIQIPDQPPNEKVNGLNRLKTRYPEV